jgi:hypothetical protein
MCCMRVLPVHMVRSISNERVLVTSSKSTATVGNFAVPFAYVFTLITMAGMIIRMTGSALLQEMRRA